MPPIKKRCCIPYCKNVQELSKKQFFKIGANLERRERWLPSIGTSIAAKSQILYCCEDHFDLPNDAENYITCKYLPETKLKLRPNVIPQRNLPLNVCRLCLKLIFNTDDFVEISRTKGEKNAQIIAATLPELDLSITVEPVACVKCFDPLERYYRIKQSALNSEVIVVNCIKSIVKRSPTRLLKNCEIDLFEEYNDIKELLEKEKEISKISEEPPVSQDYPEAMHEDNQETDKGTEEIVIEIEERNDDNFLIEGLKMEGEKNIKSSPLQIQLEDKSNYGEVETKVETSQKHASEKEVMSHIQPPQCSIFKNSDTSEKTNFTVQNIKSLQNFLINKELFEIVNIPMEGSSDNMDIHIEKEPLDHVELLASQL